VPSWGGDVRQADMIVQQRDFVCGIHETGQVFARIQDPSDFEKGLTGLFGFYDAVIPARSTQV
jgi:hypothetical protein